MHNLSLLHCNWHFLRHLKSKGLLPPAAVPVTAGWVWLQHQSGEVVQECTVADILCHLPKSQEISTGSTAMCDKARDSFGELW